MSVRVLSKVLRESPARLGERLVLIALADSASDDGVTWASQETLADMARLSNSQTRKCLDALDAAGQIERRKAQRGRRRISVYRVLLNGLAEVDYDRLPFAVSEPFTTTAEYERSSASTTAEIRTLRPPKSARASIERLKEPLVEGKPPSGGSPSPRLEKVNDRNLGFDALAEVCQIDLRNKTRAREVGTALKDIRAYAWEGANDAARAAFTETPVLFENALAFEIRRRADLYRKRMGDAELTPLALAKWWHDVAKPKPTKRTGWRWVRGGGGSSGTYVEDPEGTDRPPAGYSGARA